MGVPTADQVGYLGSMSALKPKSMVTSIPGVSFSGSSIEVRQAGAIIDGFGPDGVAAAVIGATNRVVRIQTGYVYHYAFAMMLGVAAFITWYLVGGVR